MISEIIDLQPRLSQYFCQVIKQNKLAHAYLFCAQAGMGKKKLARYCAQAYFCKQKKHAQPCLACEQCVRIAQGIHPDVVEITPQGSTIKVEQIRHLKDEFTKSGVEGKQKFFIIESAEKMSLSAANSLLKFLEEPSGQVTAFLLTTHENLILPTILSRCQICHLDQLSAKKCYEALLAKQVPSYKASILVNLTTSPQKAEEILEEVDFERLLNVVWQWYAAILKGDYSSFIDVQTKFLPLLEEQDAAKMRELIFNLILLLARDCLLLRYQQVQQVTFKNQQAKLQQLTQALTATQLTAGIEIILTFWKKLTFNMSFQGILEALTLNLLTCYQFKK